MRIIPDRFKHNGLFITMFLITFLIIITVSAAITWSTIRMSEQFFIGKFSITNYKVMNEIKESFESFNYSIVIASNKLLESGTIKRILTDEETNIERLSSYFTLDQQMNRIKANLDAYETGIIVTGKNGISYATDRYYWPITDEELKRSSIARNTLKEPKRLLYQYDYRAGQTNDGRENFIVASRALMERISGNVYGSMYVAIKESDFREFYSNYTSPGNDVFVVDKLGVIISSSQNGLIGKETEKFLLYASKIRDSPDPYIIDNFMGRDQIILMEYLPSFDLYLFNLIDKQTAIGDLIDKKAILFISAGIVLLALIVVFLASRRLTNSLSRLVKQIEDASKYNFDQYVEVTGIYETREIGRAFNSMLDELHKYVEQLMLAQKGKRNAELAALQQQINPHFLYNTLASIKFMVMQGGKKDAELTINALISLLQNTVGNVSETVTVKQELENLKNYVFINQKRYGDRIKVNYFIAPNCLEHHIPKLILQPFMENSFFHGFNIKAEGYINVLVWKDGNSLICEIVDNGDGMEVAPGFNLPCPKKKQQLFSGIGVRNVHERIQLIYGEEYGVTITSKPREGTKVRILFPVHPM